MPCGISPGGTWQKRGFSSLNGCDIVMSIDSGEVLDAEQTVSKTFTFR